MLVLSRPLSLCRLAADSEFTRPQFSVLFLHHLGGSFSTEVGGRGIKPDLGPSVLTTPPSPQDFELDLLGVKPGAQVPALLGKLLNTLANDRNCK